MRVRTMVALVALVFALALGFTARAIESDPLNALAGIFWVVTIVAAVSLLPWWSRVVPEVAPMPGLFTPVRRGQRWCTRCGTATAASSACKVCGHVPKAKVRRLWGKGKRPARAPPAKAASKPRRS